MRLRSLAEVVDHLGASGKTGIIDGTEFRVRRPAVGRKDRDTFIFGKNKQNAVKFTVVTDGEGRVLWCSPVRPASPADITHVCQLGLVKLLLYWPAVEILAYAGYQGLPIFSKFRWVWWVDGQAGVAAFVKEPVGVHVNAALARFS
ncbi:transposase family protein [Streptomyces sp. NPDC005953]|uniref:transposase family protein n=1 Tax=Streptomyces sp. NPDC005953 TaxID=3156719 RepID=UPI0034040FC6